jgi:6-hydroxynicotinate 3-monooxygenase
MGSPLEKGKIAIIGARPGGMATALAAYREGFDVKLYERHAEIRAAGNILNLWPPPQKILGLVGVNTADLGAACHTTFRNAAGKLRADVRLSDDVEKEFGGGFIGLVRWGLYKRMLDALPAGVLQLGHNLASFEDGGDRVRLNFEKQESIESDILVGADGLNSIVRKTLWGDQPIRRQFLHLIGGWLFDERGQEGEGVISHNRTTQVSYTPIRHDGKWGYEWWVLESFKESDTPPIDRRGWAMEKAREFPPFVRELIRNSPEENTQHWEIRDRPPLPQWSKGRVTLVGDAAHPTSPYAAYGAGMSIEDGYFLAGELAAIDVRNTAAARKGLQAFEDRRKAHTSYITELAYKVGRAFHHAPAATRPIRDFIYDHTSLLQKMVGDRMPSQILSQLAEISDMEKRRAGRGGLPLDGRLSQN